MSDASGAFPFKEAFITPVNKKPGLDSADVDSYQLISNLSAILSSLNAS